MAQVQFSLRPLLCNSMAQAMAQACKKGTKFLAVAVHLMVQKPTSAWLVDGWRHTFVSTWEPPTSSCFVVLDRCCHRAPRAQETLSTTCLCCLSLSAAATLVADHRSHFCSQFDQIPQPFL